MRDGSFALSQSRFPVFGHFSVPDTLHCLGLFFREKRHLRIIAYILADPIHSWPT